MPRLTKTQVKNLHKLGNYLAALPDSYEHFDIESFARRSNYDDNLFCWTTPHNVAKMINNCGSSACGIGHGPVIGLRPKRKESWWDYGSRVFGAAYDVEADDESRSLWVDVFSEDWTGKDNHHHKLVERLDRWLDENGYPARQVFSV